MYMISTNPMGINLLGSRYFWAAFLIFIGTLLMIGQLFGFPIPLFRIVVTTILVTAGVQLVLKASNLPSSLQVRPDQQTVLLGAGEKHITTDNVSTRYYTVLGSQILDLRNLTPDSPLYLEVNTLLGEVHLYLPRFSSIQIRNTTFLGRAKGIRNINQAQSSGQPLLTLDAHTVLGSLTVHPST
jgi:predicted membrane protein